MRISSKGRLAVNAMIDLALRESAGPVALGTIGARQRVSMSYLEQIFSRLRQRGLVGSTRGPGGGYTLGRTAGAISVADMVLAVDDDLSAPFGANEDLPGEDPARQLWARLSEEVLAQMGTITLAELVDEQIAGGVSVEMRPPRAAAVPLRAAVQAIAPNSVFAFGRSFVR